MHGISAICLVIGLGIGLFLLGFGHAARLAQVVPPSSASGAMPGTHLQITVSSLVDKAKSDPNNAALLAQVGNLYYDAKQ